MYPRLRTHLFQISLLKLATAMLGACFSVVSSSLASAASPPDSEPLTTFVVLGKDGMRIARALVKDDVCPSVTLDNGTLLRMKMRARAGTMALRPTHAAAGDSTPAIFSVSTCERTLPPHTRSASINGRPLPLSNLPLRRIVVIGDTGCRLLKAMNGYQACNDPEKFPLARIAGHAANWKPDLVIHLGDYHYREDRCPPDNAGCAGSPWGYGYDTWREDFFRPARKLLQAAPWVMVRGNHERCKRAGQGWWRFLDPHPLIKGRDCNNPAFDAYGNYSEPYSVPLDDKTQLIVADSSFTPEHAIKRKDVRFKQYRNLYRKLEQLASRAKYNIALFHQPVLGFFINDKQTLFSGNAGLQSVFRTLNPRFFPSTIHTLLSGHVHTWQQISFSTPHPTQFVVGFSGTALDPPLPDTLVGSNHTPAAGAVIESMSVWPRGKFGYMTMERAGFGRWNVKVWDQTGHQVRACRIAGRKSICKAVPSAIPGGR